MSRKQPEGHAMFETLLHLAAAVAATVVLAVVAPPGTPLLPLIAGMGLLTLVLPVVRQGHGAVVTVIEALARLRGR